MAILILMFMITIHELGHYVAGKLLGFKINEFSIGFGKAIFKRQSKKTGEIFAIRIIPLGGYCAFEGMDAASSAGTGPKPEGEPEEKVLPGYLAEKSDSYVPSWAKNKTEEEGTKKKGGQFVEMHPWKRLVVLFAGGFFNFLSAIVFSIILLMIVGYNQGVRVGSLTGDSPNADNLLRNDIILGVVLDDGSIDRMTPLRGFGTVVGGFRAGDTPTLLIYRQSEGEIRQEIIIAELVNEQTGATYIGMGMRMSDAEMVFLPMSFFPAIWQGILFSFELAWLILSFLWLLVSGQMGLTDVGGPIATVSVMAESVSNSLLNIFILIPIISVNLALFNLLPIPALDGARMVFVGIEWVRGKPVNPDVEGRIHLAGFFLLIGFVLIADMNWLFGSGRGMLEHFGRWRL